MVTAAELLNSLSTTNSEAEGHIIIGNDRRIVVPTALKRIAVQYDHNVETVIFDCPRYWDGLDMSKMAVYINYMRSDGYTDSYPVGTITVDGTNSNIMHFNWTISRNVTEVAGAISFLVCIKKTDGEGNEVNHWNSELCQDMRVSEGMETDEQYIEYNADLITQLLLEVAEVKEINVQASEMQNLLAQTQAAKAETEAARDIALDESDYIKNTYANAFKGKVGGEVIRLNNVSPIEHDVMVKVSGKNIFPHGTLNFTRNQNVTLANPLPPGTYTLSTLITSSDTDGEMSALSINSGSEVLAYRTLKRNERVAITFTVSKPVTNLDFCAAYNYSQGEGDVATWADVQIEANGMSSDYEPYIDPTTVTVFGCSKNLIPYPYADTTLTRAGITYTIKDDRTIVANGTSSGSYFNVITSASKKIYFKTGITYHLSGVPSNNSLYYMYAKDAAGINFFDHGTGASFTPTVDGYGAVTIVVQTDANISNVVFQPQITVSSTKEDYEPYSGGTYTPASDGAVDVASISPNMTIFTDTPGVKIEAEYNRDIHSVVGDIGSALDAIIAIQNSILG